MSLFKQYKDKNSILKRYSRQTQGGDNDIFQDKLGWWEKRTDIPTNQIDDIRYEITSQTQFRPDLIAFLTYGRADLNWLVLQYNNIIDVNEEMTAGTIISLPSVDRVFFDIAIRPLQRNVRT